ncbi:MAG: N-acetyltransferase [Gammaproteobacteria bacterium SHHR-1]|uniref:GNAT family N-acetyltransferase n=1 Tax=Magnetovirga frankeli TaxID=947516 RepID=UPI001293DB31|nr:N-acetyltransferase [gamma proteobacterium SS-5]
MEFTSHTQGREAALIELFRSTFAASEGSAEGTLISNLVRKLLADTPAEDLIACLAEDQGELLGACLFSRLSFAQDGRSVFLLAPVAVTHQRQRTGIGQQMLNQGLELLRQQGMDAVLTYGDPNFYQRVGFRPISSADVCPPLPLRQPQGWLGQSLTTQPLSQLKGPSHCVNALHDPAFW